MRCVCCGDPPEALDSRGRTVCQACYYELEHGIISNQNISFHVGRTRDGRSDHPEWDAAIRQIEDQTEVGLRM